MCLLPEHSRRWILGLLLIVGAVLLAGGLWSFWQLRSRTFQEGTRLDPTSRQPLERVLAEGQAHRFSIPLEIDQYLQLLVEQRGVDLESVLRDPRGRPLLTVDNPSGGDGAWGPERVRWVAEDAGPHEVEVHGSFPLTPTGAYTVRIEALRPATAEDRQLVAAEKALTEGDALSGTEAKEKYEAALAGFQALGDSPRTADTYFRLGETWDGLQQEQAALEAYRRALELYRELGNPRQQAITLYSIGYIQQYRGETGDAYDHLVEARSLFQQENDPSGEALTANQLGILHRQWGEGREATIFYDTALRRWRELGDQQRAAVTLYNRGILNASLGNKEHALADLRTALSIYQQVRNPMDVAETLIALGEVHLKWGEVLKADDYFRQTEEVLKAAPDRQDLQARLLTDLGWAHLRKGYGSVALDHFQRARVVIPEQDSPTSEAWVLLGIGFALDAMGNPRAALASFEQAQTLFSDGQVHAGTSEALFGQAVAWRHLEDFSQARSKIETVLDRTEDVRARTAAGSEIRASFFATQQKYYDFYIDLLMEQHHRDPNAGHAAAAFETSERARARSLLELLATTEDRLKAHADPVLRAAERDLKRRINDLEFQIMRLTRGETAEGQASPEQARRQQDALLRKLQTVRERIAATPEYKVWARTLGIEEIRRQLLDDDTLLLEYRLGEPKSFLWVLTRQDLAGFELPGRIAIEEAARKGYRQIIHQPRQGAVRTEKTLTALSEILLSPVSEWLAVKRRLLIVSDGALQYLPFGALEASPSRPLIEEHEIITAPSASVLTTLREQWMGRSPAPKLLAMIADPVFQSQDPRLQTQYRTPGSTSGSRTAGVDRYQRLVYSGQEATSILAMVPPEQRFQALGFEARREVVTSGLLARYRIVHFATHADLHPENPELSRLVLSLVDEGGNPQADGLLYADDIYDLDLSAELVVLSACQTALGQEIRGEGLWGMTQGFMDAGAARVIVSLWSVDDQATAELMERFYRNLLLEELPPAMALQRAQAFIRQQERWRAPYFWAGFVLQGDWRDVSRPSR